MATQHYVWTILVAYIIILCLQNLVVNGQPGSLGFYLNGTAYHNGSTVLRNDIGEDDAALQCTTNSTTCCSNSAPEMRAGEFIFPGGQIVPIKISVGVLGYYRDRRSQFIRLNRLSNATLTGQFRCVIPDASGTNASLFVDVVDINVSIATFGTNSSGELFGLECSVEVNGSTDQVNFTWLDPSNDEVPFEMINATNSTSTLIFNPLSISHAGTYSCRVTLGEVEQKESVTVGVEADVFLSLRGNHILNNSYVDVNEIGAGGAGGISDIEGLLCHTNKMDCCGSGQVSGGDILGHWFFPNGTVVNSRSSNLNAGRTDFFFRNRFQSVVRLLRVGQPLETGFFRCEVPDASNTNQSLYVNIVNVIPTPTTSTFLAATTTIGSTPSPTPSIHITVSITSLGINTAGEVLTLQCSTGTMSSGFTNQLIPTITWLNSSSQLVTSTGDGTKAISAIMMNPNGGYFSTLSFDPLLASDAGLYMCRVMVGSIIRMETITINVSVIHVTDPVIQISDGGRDPLVGQNYTINCNIMGNFNNLTYTYQWRRNSALLQMGPILSFSSLQLSDAGQYICEITGDVNAVSDIFNVTLQVPTPIVSVTGPDSVNPYNGTTYNLTGTIQLDMSIVNMDVIVATWEWTLAGKTLRFFNAVPPVYQSVLIFRPLATNSSGEYHLTVTLRPLNNTDYITESSASNAYNISVLPLPHNPPSIAVISRHPIPDDVCGEAMSLSCTGNVVEGLLIPPAIVWIDPSGNLVPTGENHNPTVDAETRNLVFSDITLNNRGVYTCRAVVNIPGALISNHSDQSTASINTTFPGIVENLNCAMSSSPNHLLFSWELPGLLGNDVIDYRVEVMKLQSIEGTQNLIELEVASFKTNKMIANITRGLEPEVPYSIKIKALNSAGCGEEQQIYCFTQEGVPPVPTNLTAVRFNSTTIGVSWTRYTLVQLRGLASYVITYDIIISSPRKRQFKGIITVPWTNNTVIISNLQPGAQYDVTVQTSTSAGMSAPISIRTINEPESSPDNSMTVIAVVCGVVAVVIVLSVAAIFITALRYAMKVRRRKTLNLATRSFNSPFMMANEFYESGGDHLIRVDTIDQTADPGYETLDKYSETYANRQAPQPYLEIEIKEKHLPQQPQLSSTVGFAQCPLYASAACNDPDGKVADKTERETSFSPLVPSSGNSRPIVDEEERYVVNELQDGHAEAAYATVR